MELKILKELDVSTISPDNIYDDIDERTKKSIIKWQEEYYFSKLQEGLLKIVRVRLGELGQYSPLTWRDTQSKIKSLGFTTFNIGTIPFLFHEIRNESVNEPTHVITDQELTYNYKDFHGFVFKLYDNKQFIDYEKVFNRGTEPWTEYDERYSKLYQRPKFHSGWPAKHLILKPADYITFIKS